MFLLAGFMTMKSIVICHVNTQYLPCKLGQKTQNSERLSRERILPTDSQPRYFWFKSEVILGSKDGTSIRSTHQNE
jgi:hypothetical protein